MDPDADVDPFQNLQWILGCLMIKIEFLARKFLYWNFILQPLFQSAQNFYEKRQGIRKTDPEHWFNGLASEQS